MTIRLAFFALLLAGLSACAGDSAEVQRGPLGKADNVGSCVDSGCDGPAPVGNCWCDEDCTEFGDCCSDREEVCLGDAQACGGFAGLRCGEGQYCHYGQDRMCGAADHLGECRELPELCPEIYAPVCGCDGETYENACRANAAGTSVLHEGECPAQEPALCGGFAGWSCPEEGQYCHFAPEFECGSGDRAGECRTAPQACPQDYAPVCGCNGTTYSNECHANAAGTSVLHEGPCAK